MSDTSDGKLFTNELLKKYNYGCYHEGGFTHKKEFISPKYFDSLTGNCYHGESTPLS